MSFLPYGVSALQVCVFPSVRGFRTSGLCLSFRTGFPHFRLSLTLATGFSRASGYLCNFTLVRGFRTSDLHLSFRTGFPHFRLSLSKSLALKVFCSPTGAFPRLFYGPANRPVPQKGTKQCVQTPNKAVVWLGHLQVGTIHWLIISDNLVYDF